MRIPARITVAAAVVAFSAIAAAASFAVGQVLPPKVPPTLPPSAEYERIGQQIAAKNAAFLNQFVASGASARSLPRKNVSSYDRGPATLSTASKAAAAILVGRVTATSFSPNGAGLPIADSTVTVDRMVAGNVPSTIHVFQLGGPMQSDTGPVLAQLEVDEVLLPGDNVVLFLTIGPDGTNRVVPGAGTYRVAGGRVSASRANPFAASVNELGLDEFLARVVSAR